MLLPPILRGPVLVAMAHIATNPILTLLDDFTATRKKVSKRIHMTSNVNMLEKVLNDLFFLQENQIYITTTLEPLKIYLYPSQTTKTSLYFHGVKELLPPTNIRECKGVSPDPTFIIHIPTFLCTSLDREKDSYGGKYLTEIYTTLNYYKPAGRAYRVELYDYE